MIGHENSFLRGVLVFQKRNCLGAEPRTSKSDCPRRNSHRSPLDQIMGLWRTRNLNTLVCWNCGKSINDVPLPISRHSQCSHCFNELHCCRLCKHYDPERSTYCFEERADTPVQKENANFCDYFTPKPNT